MAMSALGELNRSVSLDNAALDLVKYAKALMACQGRRDDALALCVARGASSRLTKMFEAPVITSDMTDRLLAKGPIAIGSVGGSTWGDELAPFRESSAAFAQSLTPFSAFDRILADGGFMRMPLHTRISVASSAALGSSASELAPKPISAMSFAQEYLTAYKAVALVVISDELATSMAPGANDLFAGELRKAVAKATDTRFFEVLTEDTNIISNASTGTDASAILADLSTAVQAIDIGVGSRLYFIASPSVIANVAIKLAVSGTAPNLRVDGGGTFAGITFIRSDAATTDAVVLAGDAIAADSDLVTTDVVRHATVRMDDNPTSGTHSLISLWQANLQCLRAERFFGAAVLRPTGVAIITGMGST